MARRGTEEINAGSMADIAFLLLIFFIVTTTMDLEAGIPDQMAMKIDCPDCPEPKINQRDIFSIKVNSSDNLLVENNNIVIDDLKELLIEWFTANMYQYEKNPTHVMFFKRELNECKAKLKEAQEALEEKPEDVYLKSTVSKWEKRVMVCEAMPNKEFLEFSENGMIRLEQQSGSSYGNYIAIKNIIKEVIFELRDQRCREIFNGLSYKELDLTLPEDFEKEKILNVLIPEKLIEPAITK